MFNTTSCIRMDSNMMVTEHQQYCPATVLFFHISLLLNTHDGFVFSIIESQPMSDGWKFICQRIAIISPLWCNSSIITWISTSLTIFRTCLKISQRHLIRLAILVILHLLWIIKSGWNALHTSRNRGDIVIYSQDTVRNYTLQVKAGKKIFSSFG